MDTLGPRVMVNVGTQAVSTTGLNPRDLAPLTNDAFLATFLGKPVSSATNGPARQQNNYRQSYSTQTERGTLRSKTRASTSNGGDSMEPDSAILSIIRGNGTENQPQSTSQRSSQGNRYRRRSFNQQQLLGNGFNDIPCSPNYRPNSDLSRRRRTRSGGAQQQITVVDQMAAQPHIPYAILPKRFEPKQLPNNGQTQTTRSNNNTTNSNTNGGRRRRRRSAAAGNGVPSRRNQRPQDYYDDQWEDDEDDLWLEPMPPMMRRRLVRRPNRNFPPTAGYYGPRGMPRMDDYYDGYAYGPVPRPGPNALRSRRRMMYQDDAYLPFDIVPSYDLNEWQGPYARSRASNGMPQTRGGLRYGRDDNGFIRDDHRVNGSSRQSRYGNKPSTPTRSGKQAKSPKTKGANNQQKRRNSRQRKTRNQNSKTEGTPLTSSSELKTNTEQETTNEEKQKTVTDEQQQPLPQRNQENKENQSGEQKSEEHQN